MKSKKTRMLAIAVGVAAAASIGSVSASDTAKSGNAASDAAVKKAMMESFRERGIAKLDRLEQSPLQKVCTEYAQKDMPKDVRERVEKAELEKVKYPSDGQWLGDWKKGESVAQSGRGLQFTDDEKTVAGGNCYACHQLTKSELSYGNIGPSLYQYGKLRGNSEPIMKYTWAKIWNAHAFQACSQMPRFGDAGILTEAQLKDVMALLLDPNSPVNKD